MSTQRLYGEEFRGLTPPHGLAGNVHALLPFVDDARRGQLRRVTVAILARTAFVEDGLANWPGHPGSELPGPDGQIRLQWCAGAPGIVIAASDYLDEELLLAGAELASRAGPPGLEKGPGICDGTVGNGYAFLKTFERTGDERWLERARRFALHTLGQVHRMRAVRGAGATPSGPATSAWRTTSPTAWRAAARAGPRLASRLGWSARGSAQ